MLCRMINDKINCFPSLCHVGVVSLPVIALYVEQPVRRFAAVFFTQNG